MSAVDGSRAWYVPCVAENSRHDVRVYPDRIRGDQGAPQAQAPRENEQQKPGEAGDATDPVHQHQKVGWRV